MRRGLRAGRAVATAVLLLAGARATAASVNDTLFVPPYLDYIVFDIFRGTREATVTAFPPGSERPALPGSDGVEKTQIGGTFSTLVVHRPAPGLWTFRKSAADARIRVSAQKFSPRGRLIAPRPDEVVPRDARITVAYRLVDDAGAPVKESPAYPLRVELTFVAPDGFRKPMEMRRGSDATYRARQSIGCGLPGRYWTEARVTTRAGAGSIEILDDRWSGFWVTNDESHHARPVAAGGSSPLAIDRLGLPRGVAAIVIVLGITLLLQPRPRNRSVAGAAIVVVAVGLLLPMRARIPGTPDLQLVAAHFRRGAIDLIIANRGTAPGLLNRIEMQVIADRRSATHRAGEALGNYTLPIDDLQTGARRSILVRHSIEAGATDQISISPATARALVVRLTVFAAGGSPMSADVPLFVRDETRTLRASLPEVR